jgi:hypothetical protein
MEFTYNASACAAGGVIQRRNGEFVVIPSLASVALAPTGGEGVTAQHNFGSEAVSFSYAETRVFGREVSESVYTTETNVYITNLRVFDILSIAMLSATVTSTRKVDRKYEDDDHAFDLEATYHGVEVRDPRDRTRRHQIGPKVDLAVKSLKRYKHLSELVDSKPGGEFRAHDGTPLLPCSDTPAMLERFNAKNAETLKKAIGETKPILGALVEDVEGEIPAESAVVRKQKLHKVFIPGLGTVRFGELMLKPGRRRVNLLRIELVKNELFARQESDEPADGEELLTPSGYQGGSLVMGSVEGNGSPLYP